MKREVNMRRNDWLTPEGTRDLLFEECAAKRYLEDRITGIFENYGYSEVITPGIEFYDVFNGKARHFAPETMYKLVDGKNRLMVLRPDTTMPIARLCATRLRDEELPLKLFYNQSIFMVNPKDSGRDDEFEQSGIEIIGGENEDSDYEALFLAAKALGECDEDYRIEIGDSGIFSELLSQYNYSDEQQTEKLRVNIEDKNYPAIDDMLADDKSFEALRMLPRLFGGFEAFEEARKFLCGEAIEKKLARLERLCRELAGIIPEEKIRVDLGLVNKKNYYTGIIFKGYVEGYGQPVLSGGRYDTLIGEFGGREAKAVGFAVNIEAAAKVYLKNKGKSLAKTPDVLVFSNDRISALKHCEKLIAEGFSVRNFNGVCPNCAEKFAKKHGIKRLDVISENGETESREV